LGAKNVYKYIKTYKKLPNSVTIAGTKFSMPEFLYLMSKTIVYKYKKSNSNVNVKYNIKNPSKPSGVKIKGKLTKYNYRGYANNIIKFINAYNKAPNNVNTKLGKMYYQTAIYTYSRILAWSYSNKKALPNYISLNIKSTHSMNKYLPKFTASSSSSSSSASTKKLSQSAIWSASKSVKSYVLKYGHLPNSVTISGKKLSMAQYMYLVSKAIAYKYKGSSVAMTIKTNVKDPASPFGDTIKKVIPKSKYYDIAKRTYQYINKYNQAPNYVSSNYGKLQYQTAIYAFARIGAYLANYKKIPSSVTVKVAKTHNLNKYKPSSASVSSSVSSNGASTNKIKSNNKNAIWVHSGDMNENSGTNNPLNLSLLVEYGIGNVFIHEDIFKRSDARSWIKEAAGKGIKVHIWFTCFYDVKNKKWINPVSGGKVNQAYFNKMITRAKTYVKYDGVAGIHLDYLRYPGTAYQTNGGTKAITEFVRQLNVAVKAINPKIILSAAVMPETYNNDYYYGQDIPQLGKYLDVIVPMIYEGNYKANNAWITSTTKWFVQNSGGAEIWGGLQGYYSDSNTKKLSVSALKADVSSVLKGGAPGIAIFRWGTANLFSLLNL
jgi:hypothetical protein